MKFLIKMKNINQRLTMQQKSMQREVHGYQVINSFSLKPKEIVLIIFYCHMHV